MPSVLGVEQPADCLEMALLGTIVAKMAWAYRWHTQQALRNGSRQHKVKRGREDI